MKLAVLFDRFGPYHVARLRGASQFAEIFALEGAPHRAIYDWSIPDLPASISYSAVTSKKGEELDPKYVADRLDELLVKWKPDALALPGWSNLITLTAIRWAERRGIPLICMSESNSWDFKRGWLSERVKRGIVRHYGAGLITSLAQREYLEELGVSTDAISSGYNVVDNDFFAEEANRWRNAAQLPAPLDGMIPLAAKNRYFLASNRFVPKKNLRRLLIAYAGFRSGRTFNPADWPLILLGDGGLRQQIEELILKLGLGNHVQLPGFRQVDELPKFYGTAGAFIHASTTEQWGLVVNEAMASGLPVAVSNRCGCADYLVEDGVTGFSFDPNSINEIERAFRRLVALPSDRHIQSAALTKVDQLRPEKFGEALAAAASAAICQIQQPQLLDRKLLDLSILRARICEGKVV